MNSVTSEKSEKPFCDLHMNKENRKYRRFQCPLSTRLILISGEGRHCCLRFYRTRLLDLSLGGVSILTTVLELDGIHFFYNHLPTVRNQILMKLYLPDERQPITALGYAIDRKVVRTNGRKAYRVGINFLQISRSNAKNLRLFLDTLSRKEVLWNSPLHHGEGNFHQSLPLGCPRRFAFNASPKNRHHEKTRNDITPNIRRVVITKLLGPDNTDVSLQIPLAGYEIAPPIVGNRYQIELDDGRVLRTSIVEKLSNGYIHTCHSLYGVEVSNRKEEFNSREIPLDSSSFQ